MQSVAEMNAELEAFDIDDEIPAASKSCAKVVKVELFHRDKPAYKVDLYTIIDEQNFIIYPKYFYKSRLYGTTLMDLGLGFYVISHAMVANEARGIFLKASVWSTFIKVCKDVIPLVFLGLARYFATSGFGYHVPVQEYGVHWNFFFTLAVIKLGSTVLFFLTPPSLHAFLGPCILATHQLLLSKAGLREFVIVGYGTHFSRNGIIEANREGIVATVGFLAIFFIGVQLGKILMAKRRTIGEWLQALAQLVIVCVSSWLLFNVASVFAERPSRKFANLAYACFIIGISSLLMVKLLLFDIVTAFFRRIATPGCQSGKTSPFEESCDRTCRLLQAINYNGLLFFVIANLVTGLFNLFADTMLYSHAEAFVIVSVYMLLLSAISLHLYNRKASLKALIWGSTRINKTSSAA
ncbi:phosphatidylinositol-glycan biosynthesis class W protein-like [Dreissena polymorpha]|uniref:phosphatidylinositol-glycan biosynthesis class W protein-like n=1 Tax=Dreissena polymorpha TaxID=45954 RepID=UPI00226492CA|nr:phosphatidylinositol-glycan biosynthesis class W protein-like [Dreissena polymorpha]